MPLPSYLQFLVRNLLVTLWEFPCMIFVSFSLLLLVFFFVCSFCQFDYYVSQHIPPWVYPAWDSLCFLDFSDSFLSCVSEVFGHYLFKYFLRPFLSLFSFWDPYSVNVGVFNVVLDVFEVWKQYCNEHWGTCVSILVSSACMLSSGIAGSYSRSIPVFKKSPHCSPQWLN